MTDDRPRTGPNRYNAPKNPEFQVKVLSIDKGVPVPRPQFDYDRLRKYKFHTLTLDESMVVSAPSIEAVGQAIIRARRQTGKRFIVRETSAGVFRVWCVFVPSSDPTKDVPFSDNRIRQAARDAEEARIRNVEENRPPPGQASPSGPSPRTLAKRAARAEAAARQAERDAKADAIIDRAVARDKGGPA